MYYAVLKMAPKSYTAYKDRGDRQVNIEAGTNKRVYEHLFSFAAITCSRLKHECAHLKLFSTMAEKIDEAARI